MNSASRYSSLLASLLLSYAVLAESVPSGQPGYLEENIPITMANIRGHKALYREGWFVISSTEEALQYAHKHSITSSGVALSELQNHLKNRSAQFGSDIKGDIQQGYQSGTQIWDQGTKRSSKIVGGTHQLAQKQLDFSSRGFTAAWDRFIQGNINLVERTEEDRSALISMPGNYYTTIKDDFSNLYELSEDITSAVAPKIENGWSVAFARAGEEFNREYEESAKAGNSLSALFYIAWGYLKSAYYGLLEPGARSITTGVTTTVNFAGQTLFLPTAGVLIITGRTVQSIGQTIYYTTKTGYKIISPTLEGGVLASLALLSASTTPLTYTAGTTIGVINQVAITTAAPVVTVAQSAVTTTGDTLKYAGLVSYDVAKGTGKVVINQVSSGVVLGYNALTAIPSQLLMGSINSAFFLAWDGPKLIIASVTADNSDDSPLSTTVGQLPVGTVVNLDKLRSTPGISVELISDDPEVINRVLEKLPDDLRR